MGIAASSTIQSQAILLQQASMSVMKLAMDNSRQTAQFVNDMMSANTQTSSPAAHPHLGNRIDLSI